MKTNNITEKLGLQGKITQKHSEDIEEIIQQKLQEVEQRKVEEIRDDIKSVLNMLDGDTDREKIANYVREYLLIKTVGATGTENEVDKLIDMIND